MSIGKKVFRQLKRLFLRKHLREISFTLGTITFKEWLAIIAFLLFRRKDIISGKYIQEFEARFGQYIGARYAFSFGAGRMAFYAILKAMDIKQGDEVILPGYTCVVVPNAVIYTGARPVYVDINPETLTIDASQIEQRITSRTRAILAQHMFSAFCDMEAISQIAARHHLKVIEDCAHALGAEYRGRQAGNFGDAAFFTTEQSKIITTWMGGMAVTNDAALASQLRHIQAEAEFPDAKATRKMMWQLVLSYALAHPATVFIGRYFQWLLSRLGILTSNITAAEMAGQKPAGYPLRLTNIQAKVGLRQLENIPANLEHRRAIAQIYEDALKNLGIGIYRTDGYRPAHIRYAFLARDRQKLSDLFRHNQIELGQWYNSVMHPQGSALQAVYYQAGSCPVAELIAEHAANLPTHPSVSLADAGRIVRLLQQRADWLLDARQVATGALEDATMVPGKIGTPPYDPNLFWDERFKALGHTGWSDSLIYRYDQPLRLRAIDRTLRKTGVSLNQDTRVLDIGCGTGDLIDVLAKNGSSVTGVDISREVVNSAARIFAGNRKIRILLGKVEELSLPPGSFDLVTSVTVLQHIVDEASFLLAVKLLAAALKKGGHIILLELCARDSSKAGSSPHLARRRRQQWIAAFEGEGYRLVRESTYPEWGIQFLHGVERFLGAALLRRRGGQSPNRQPAAPSANPAPRGFYPSLHNALRYLVLSLAYPLDHWLFVPFPSRWADYRIFVFQKP